MQPFDIVVPHFRLAKERWPDAPNLGAHYDAVASSYGSTGFGIIGTVKSFVECVCLTILGEFGKNVTSDASTTLILGEALKALKLDSGRVASKLGKLVSAHNKMADALTEMRNENDPIAHGKDGFIETLTTNECRAFLVTADSILALILAACDGSEPDLKSTREPYERFFRFHEQIDVATSLEAEVDRDTDVETLVLKLSTANMPDGFSLRLEPSKLLYALDREMYVQLLGSTSAPIGVPEPQVTTPALVEGMIQVPSLPSTTAEIVAEYSGRLSILKAALQEFLSSLGGLEAASAASGTQLRDSLLASADRDMGLDWSIREPLLAAIKVSVRKTLTKFGVETTRAEQSSEKILTWLIKNAASLTESAPAA